MSVSSWKSLSRPTLCNPMTSHCALPCPSHKLLLHSESTSRWIRCSPLSLSPWPNLPGQRSLPSQFSARWPSRLSFRFSINTLSGALNICFRLLLEWTGWACSPRTRYLLHHIKRAFLRHSTSLVCFCIHSNHWNYALTRWSCDCLCFLLHYSCIGHNFF